MVPASLVLAYVLASALATPSSRVILEHRNSIPQDFTRIGPAIGSATLNLRIALTSKDLPGLEKALYDVSTPSSSNYGHHLSKAEVEAFVAPSLDTTSVVHSWLASHGLNASPSSPAGDWLSFSVDVQKANELFDTDFSVFTHQATGEQLIRTLVYSVPASLRDHVQLVHPTTSFFRNYPKRPVYSVPISLSVNLSMETIPQTCASSFRPLCAQALYGIPTTAATQLSNTLGVAGFFQLPDQADLKKFLQNFRPDMNPATTFTLLPIDRGELNPIGMQGNLDIQYTVGVATGVPTVFITVGTSTSDGAFGFLDIINYLLSLPEVPRVLTIGYFFNEGEVSPSLQNAVCNSYVQLGARGVSIIFASGDGGVAGDQSASCTTFVPTFPSTCPFVTSVGGTAGISPETAASFSSGGFSNFFGTPSYQLSAVSGYLSFLGNTNSGKFNSSGRAFPDVSAHAENFILVHNGLSVLFSGTECSADIFASIIALINSQLAAVGKQPLGFLNPFLYSTGKSAFTDITAGSNPGCNTNGFPATTGWDPVTGLGTPNFTALKAALVFFGVATPSYKINIDQC